MNSGKANAGIWPHGLASHGSRAYMIEVSPEGLEILLCFATALTAGFVIGAEREQGRDAAFAGARTFPMYALAGAVAALLGIWAFAAVSFGICLLIGIAYYRDTRSGGDLGMSSEAAAVVTVLLGGLCTTDALELPLTDRLLLVGAGAVAVLALLGFKKALHQLIAKVSEEDVYATTKLLLLALVLLPVLPNRALGPWAALNPRAIGTLVLLISGIGFAGYITIRAYGARRGLALTGLLGGLASSTAVALSFSGRAKEQPQLVNGCAVAIVLASSTMFPRVLLEVSAVSTGLIAAAVAPAIAAAAAGTAVAAVYYFRVGQADRRPDAALALKNPFTLKSALKFTLLFTFVLLFSRAAAHSFADTGVLVSAAVTGLADADAIALSVARMHSVGEVDADLALTSIGIAVAMNTFSKTGIAFVVGGRALGMRVGAGLGAALLAGAAVMLLT